MNNLRNTFIQENHPSTRRRSLTTLDSLLRSTRGQSFLDYISGIKQHKKSLRQSEEAIASHFKKISGIITMVDDHIFRRLENHQNEIFSIVKAEIEEMREETKSVVEKLNDLIVRKNNEDEVWNLSNQLDYFKMEALKIFNENKKMKSEIITFKTLLKQADIQLENNNALMKNLKKKYMKQKLIKQKIIFTIREKIKDQNLTKEDLEQILKIDKQKNRLSLKTQHVQKTSSENQIIRQKIRDFLNRDDQANNQADNEDFMSKPTDQVNYSDCLSEQNSNSEIQSIKVRRNQANQQKYNKKVDCSIQTENFQISIEKNKQSAITKHISSTIYTQFPKESHQNFEKLETNKKISSKFDGGKRHMRYMSLAFNKNKILDIRNEMRAQTGQFSIK